MFFHLVHFLSCLDQLSPNPLIISSISFYGSELWAFSKVARSCWHRQNKNPSFWKWNSFLGNTFAITKRSHPLTSKLHPSGEPNTPPHLSLPEHRSRSASRCRGLGKHAETTAFPVLKHIFTAVELVQQAEQTLTSSKLVRFPLYSHVSILQSSFCKALHQILSARPDYQQRQMLHSCGGDTCHGQEPNEFHPPVSVWFKTENCFNLSFDGAENSCRGTELGLSQKL